MHLGHTVQNAPDRLPPIDDLTQAFGLKVTCVPLLGIAEPVVVYNGLVKIIEMLIFGRQGECCSDSKWYYAFYQPENPMGMASPAPNNLKTCILFC